MYLALFDSNLNVVGVESSSTSKDNSVVIAEQQYTEFINSPFLMQKFTVVNGMLEKRKVYFKDIVSKRYQLVHTSCFNESIFDLSLNTLKFVREGPAIKISCLDPDNCVTDSDRTRHLMFHVEESLAGEFITTVHCCLEDLLNNRVELGVQFLKIDIYCADLFR